METFGSVVAAAMLGIAGSLHCGAMCGCIASGALFMLAPPTAAGRAVMLAKMHAGRLAMYALLGAASAGSMHLAFGPSTTELHFRILQWASAAVVMWVGLAMAGVVPRVGIAGRIGAHAQAVIARHSAGAFRHTSSSPWISGLLWGSAPCPLVYAAAISASLMGSAAEGALFMAAYGVGTLPSVTAVALGLTSLKAVRASPMVHASAGLAVAAFGLFVALHGLPSSAVICAPR